MTRDLSRVIAVLWASAVITAVAGFVFDGLVRADPPSGHFSVNTDGTVTDNATGLTWPRLVSTAWCNGASCTQAEAIAYCEGFDLAGGGWRLPTVTELQTIVDDTRVGPTIDPTTFPGTPSEGFWTSSLYAGATGSAWIVYFDQGNVDLDDLTGTYRVRCVR